MSAVPIMPLNVEEFFASPEVDDMDGEQAAVWLKLIAECWRRKTLLPADDSKLARILDVDVRVWRRRYKPVFVPLMTQEKSQTVSGTVSNFYRIAKVNSVWDQVANRIARNKSNAAHARAEKAAKHAKAPSAPEPKKPSDPAPIAEPAAEPEAGLYQNQDKKGGPQPSKRPAASPFLQTGNGHFAEAEPPSDPSLVERLVSDGLKRSSQPDRGSLFGALQAAIREEDDDD